jgi:hypothetical protein
MLRRYVLVSAITLPLLASLPLLTACSQEAPKELAQPPGGETPSAARLYFDDNVEIVFEGRCASCHANEGDPTAAPDYLGLSVEQYYDHLVQRTDFVSCNPENSLLLNKGFDPGHPGGDLSVDERQKIETWLNIEANQRFDSVCGGGTPPPTPDDDGTEQTTSTGGTPTPPPEVLTGTKAMEQFGECMTLTDWVDTGMPLVSNQNSNLGDITYDGCYSCHNAPQGMNLMPDPNLELSGPEIDKAYEYMRHMYASFNLVTWTVNDADGSFKDLVKSNRWRDKGIEAQADGSTHPAYELTEERQAAYEAWFDLTYARWQAGECLTGAGTGGAGGEAGLGGAGGEGQ